MARKNIKVNGDTYQRLKLAKREGETWNDFLKRLLEYHHVVEKATADD